MESRRQDGRAASPRRTPAEAGHGPGAPTNAPAHLASGSAGAKDPAEDASGLPAVPEVGFDPPAAAWRAGRRRSRVAAAPLLRAPVRAMRQVARALAARPRLRLGLHVVLAVAGSSAIASAQASGGQQAGPLFGLFFWCLVVTRTFGALPAVAAVFSAGCAGNFALLPPRGELTLSGEAGLVSLAFLVSAGVAVWMFAAVRRDVVRQRLRLAHEQHLVREHAQLLRALSRALNVRDVFLAVAGHELRSPVTAASMQAQAQVRRSNKRGEGEAAAAWQRQVHSLQRLLALVDRLLDVSRINSGQLTLQLEDVDLARVVRDVTARYEEAARRADCALSVEVPPSVVGRFDRLRVEQVVANLLSNAFKYGAGQPVRLRLGPIEGAHEAVLQVQDQGAGIADADKKRIFDCFARSAADKSVSGLGLGLWIVRQIVHAQAGTIDVDSELGRGATFTVRLPLRPNAPRS